MSAEAEALAAEIEQLVGVTDNERDQRGRHVIRNAQKTCAQCAKCGAGLAADAPVWRQAMSLGRTLFGGWSYTVAPVCERCRSDYRDYRRPLPCEGCGRSVHQEYSRRSHRRTFCCKACEKAVRATAARQRRSDARATRQCEACGETFDPPRTDARFCSSPCRQRAYRRRCAVTDNKCPVADTLPVDGGIKLSPQEHVDGERP